ncbi:MAG: ORF6N domain-containing protein [Candidatus Omnitrophica bacterium]|nr:ORF6N domain-containing protein [Candidatus Omnitrophota bacterium]
MKRVSRDIKGVDVEVIETMIYILRGQKVMLDSDLAMLYGVETKVLIQSVKRNIDRFPEDFMFLLTEKEFKILRSQFVTSSWGGRRNLPVVFTEQGVAMLSSILNSKRAIHVNISIMRTFTKIRQMMSTHKELRQKIEELEKKYDKQFHVVFAALKKIFVPEDKPKLKIGFSQK